MHRDEESEKPMEAQPGADRKRGVAKGESQLTLMGSLRAECGGRGGEGAPV